jgi:hypothetical protein
MVGNRSENFAVDAMDDDIVSAAHARGILRHSLEDRLQISGRAAYHAQDLARRRLLLERLAQRAPQAFDFVLQIYV